MSQFPSRYQEDFNQETIIKVQNLIIECFPNIKQNKIVKVIEDPKIYIIDPQNVKCTVDKNKIKISGSRSNYLKIQIYYTKISNGS
jgi:hypothetical protein